MPGQTAGIIFGATACIMAVLLAGAAGMSNKSSSDGRWDIDGCFMGDVRGETGLAADIGEAKKNARIRWRGSVRKLPGPSESATDWNLAKDHDYICGLKQGVHRCQAIARPCLGRTIDKPA